MSDQRPKWMPMAISVVEVDPLLYRTGLRAQIAVLQEVVNDCVEINDAGQEAMYECIRLKIAALRKELKNG